MPLTRCEDWPERLDAWLGAHKATPFAWGTWDCALAACDWVLVAIGADLAEGLRGYKTARGAAGAMRRFAGGGLVEVVEKVAARNGIAEVAPSYAQRGDVVLIESDRGPALGVAIETGIVCAGPGGLVRRLRRDAVRAWRI